MGFTVKEMHMHFLKALEEESPRLSCEQGCVFGGAPPVSSHCSPLVCNCSLNSFYISPTRLDPIYQALFNFIAPQMMPNTITFLDSGGCDSQCSVRQGHNSQYKSPPASLSNVVAMSRPVSKYKVS